jgi:hypothetical protein
VEHNGQLHASAALPPGKEPSILTTKEDGWDPKPIWSFGGEKNLLPMTGLETRPVGHAACRSVTVSTEIFQFICQTHGSLYTSYNCLPFDENSLASSVNQLHLVPQLMKKLFKTSMLLGLPVESASSLTIQNTCSAVGICRI